jgi:hypothetical protein
MHVFSDNVVYGGSSLAISSFRGESARLLSSLLGGTVEVGGSEEVERSPSVPETAGLEASLSFDDSRVLVATVTGAASQKIGGSAAFTTSEHLGATAPVISLFVPFSDSFDPTELFGHQESRLVAESAKVNASATILPIILAGCAVLWLVGICVMYVVKRNGSKSSMDGCEIRYEAELRQDVIDACDSDSDWESESESEGGSDVDDDNSEQNDQNEIRNGESKTVEGDSGAEQPHDLFETDEWIVGGFDVRPDIFADMRVEEG